MKNVAIIGGGPAGLMAAEQLATVDGIQVDLFDAMPSMGRKFLMAGRGGLNITHSEALPAFVARYREQADAVGAWLADFGPEQLRDWVHGLGIDTFIGTSGRVFPTEMKAAPLLRAWLHRLRSLGVVFHARHRWLGWAADGTLRFATPTGEWGARPDAVILALGGGSWSKLGSDGRWVSLLRDQDVAVRDLLPANCGFDVAWSTHFLARFSGAPVKTVMARVGSEQQRGEFNITERGIEGGLIYALSAPLRDALLRDGRACLELDLAPDRSFSRLLADLSRPRGRDSLANHLRRRVGIEGVKAALLRELLPAECLNDHGQLAAAIKALPIPLAAPHGMDEAISTAGGVCFSALNAELMLTARPGTFVVGEMLDWEAPTGGYLLTACMASGYRAAQGVTAWLNRSNIALC